MKGLCEKCQKLYEQTSSKISDYCLHCKELVLKSFLDREKSGENNAENDKR